MNRIAITNPISILLLCVLVATQVLFVANVLLLPKQADAFPVVVIADIAAKIAKVAEGILRQAALRVSEAFLNRFIAKLTEKYKIQNFLYYDQVLTDYYLLNFIKDKVSDPDLQQVYSLLYAGYITGDPTGSSGAPDPTQAAIPRAKDAILQLYLKRGGVDPAIIASRPPNMTDDEWLDNYLLYNLNSPSDFEQNTLSQFSTFEANTNTASQLEILVGNGFKAGRDKASAFISNPTAYITPYLDSAIQRRIDNDFDPNNYWAKIGAALGNFLFNQLVLDSPGGVLSETGAPAYVPDTAPTDVNPSDTPGIDIDGDGIIDAYDVNGNGIVDTPDVCIFSGTAPNCQGSVDASNPTGSTTGLTCAEVPTDMSCSSASHKDLVTRVKAYLVAQNVNLSGDCGAFEITKRVAWALQPQGVGLISKGGTNCNGFSTDKIAFTDKSTVDILGDSGQTNSPQWLPEPSNPSVVWVAPSDPGDPAGSY